MRTGSEKRLAAFDPFGEPVEGGRDHASVPPDKGARRAALAVFWGLALLLVAGRVYFADQTFPGTTASAEALSRSVSAAQ